ncbi:hypothetical protein ACIBEA_30915 [Streptomyces sp. NPDC051555]|uniref:hypothetical protein n=1 Tax=Streptomyces sp. NPDC051555 TaxID=3365657 RepID=UPI0037BA3D97
MSVRLTGAYLLALLLTVAGLAVPVARWSLIAGSSALTDYAALGVVCTAVFAGAAVAALLWIRRRTSNRTLRFLGACLIWALACGLTVASLFTWASSDVQGHYNRSPGGAGRCLAGTPYASPHVTIAALSDIEPTKATATQPAQLAVRGRFAVRPDGEPRSAQLVLSAPTKSAAPAPADARTRAILAQYGCH